MADKKKPTAAEARGAALLALAERDTRIALLEALLREARAELKVLASYVDDPAHVWPTAGLKVTAQAHKRQVARINAALKETR